MFAFPSDKLETVEVLKHLNEHKTLEHVKCTFPWSGPRKYFNVD